MSNTGHLMCHGRYFLQVMPDVNAGIFSTQSVVFTTVIFNYHEFDPFERECFAFLFLLKKMHVHSFYWSQRACGPGRASYSQTGMPYWQTLTMWFCFFVQ